MAYSENVQLEFSLDQKEMYLASWLTKKAQEYTNLFRYKREASIIAGEFNIQDNVFDQAKYDELLNTRWVVYAGRYKRYFLLKKQIVECKEFLGFTKELGDENIVIDEELQPDDEDAIETPTVEETKPVETKVDVDEDIKEEQDDIEALRAAYAEKFGKEVASGYKNNIEWIKKKLNS